MKKIWKEVVCRGNITFFLHDRERIILKKEDNDKILKENHDNLLENHGGIKKTYYRITKENDLF